MAKRKHASSHLCALRVYAEGRVRRQERRAYSRLHGVEGNMFTYPTYANGRLVYVRAYQRRRYGRWEHVHSHFRKKPSK